jgi:hypothetical protein
VIFAWLIHVQAPPTPPVGDPHPGLTWGFGLAGLLGLLVTAAGLVFSILAWRAATAAAKSAQEAERVAKETKAAVRKSDVAEDLNAMSVVADLIISAVTENKADAAKALSRYLSAQHSQVFARRDRFLTGESKSKLAEIGKQIRVTAQTLGEVGIPQDGSSRDEFVTSCWTIWTGLAEEANKLMADIEKGEES